VDPSIRQEGLKGFTFENLVGAHLVNLCFGQRVFDLCYWREDNKEIDYIVKQIRNYYS